MASPSSRSLLAAFRDRRVRPPPLRPLRDGLVVLALFTFFLVFVFLSVYLFLLLFFLTQFCLTSSSPSVAISCPSSWPPCGIRRLPPRALVFILCSCLGGMRRPKNAYYIPLPLPSSFFLLFSFCLLVFCFFSLLFLFLLSPLPAP